MDRWATTVVNAKHHSGGHYAELGGSLRGKQIASFVDTGLNATLIRRDEPLPENHPLRLMRKPPSFSTSPRCRRRLAATAAFEIGRLKCADTEDWRERFARNTIA